MIDLSTFLNLTIYAEIFLESINYELKLKKNKL